MNKYDILLKVYEVGNISKAAEYLNYSQSRVSQIISIYEKELGFPLFRRTKYGVSPTPDGLEVFDSIRKIKVEENKINDISNRVAGVLSGSLNIGSVSSISILWLPKLLKNFTELYPDISFTITSANYAELIELLSLGKLSCCFLSQNVATNFDFIPLFQDEYVAVCSAEHPFSKMISVSITDIEKESFIIPGEGTKLELGSILDSNHIHLNSKYNSTDDIGTIALVQENLGVTILPRLLLDSIPHRVCIRPLREHYYRMLGIATLESAVLPATTKQFIQYASDYISSL